LMVVFIGASGVLEYKLFKDVKVADQSAANLLALKTNIEALRANTETLQKAVASNNSVGASVAAQKVKTVAQHLTEVVQKNPKLAREVAVELQNSKTLLDMNGA